MNGLVNRRPPGVESGGTWPERLLACIPMHHAQMRAALEEDTQSPRPVRSSIAAAPSGQVGLDDERAERLGGWRNA
jgi:hypothetical protein